jgi:hypothetical protein
MTMTANSKGVSSRVFEKLRRRYGDGIQKRSKLGEDKAMANSRQRTFQWLNAALVGDTAKLETFLAEWVNINACGQDGRTALMNAAGDYHIQAVQLLLSRY